MSVRQSLHHLAVHDFEYVLILSGDQLYQMDFEAMIEQHIEKNAEISIATIPVHVNDVPGFGILKTDDQNLITAFVEKPKTDFENLGVRGKPANGSRRQGVSCLYGHIPV